MRKFGSWNKAKEKARLDQNQPNNQVQKKPEDVNLPEDKNWEELTPYQRYYYKKRKNKEQSNVLKN